MEKSVLVEDGGVASGDVDSIADLLRASGDESAGISTAANAADIKTAATEKQVMKKKKKKKSHILVSNTKKPLVFYLNLAKRFIKQYNYVELSALGMAIPTVVSISETLKRNGVAIEKQVVTSSVGSKTDEKGRMVQKAQIEIVLAKAEKLDKTIVATAPDNAAD